MSGKIDDINIQDKKLLTTGAKINMPNLEKESGMLEWAGINFGEERTHILSKSLKRLAVMSGATKLKFFGKIFGTQKDYWIASGVLPFCEEVLSPEYEKRGEGVNSKVFYVTDNLLADWI